jgi:hypothetical protein
MVNTALTLPTYFYEHKNRFNYSKKISDLYRITLTGKFQSSATLWC